MEMNKPNCNVAASIFFSFTLFNFFIFWVEWDRKGRAATGLVGNMLFTNKKSFFSFFFFFFFPTKTCQSNNTSLMIVAKKKEKCYHGKCVYPRNTIYLKQVSLSWKKRESSSNSIRKEKYSPCIIHIMQNPLHSVRFSETIWPNLVYLFICTKKSVQVGYYIYLKRETCP